MLLTFVPVKSMWIPCDLGVWAVLPSSSGCAASIREGTNQHLDLKVRYREGIAWPINCWGNIWALKSSRRYLLVLLQFLLDERNRNQFELAAAKYVEPGVGWDKDKRMSWSPRQGDGPAWGTVPGSCDSSLVTNSVLEFPLLSGQGLLLLSLTEGKLSLLFFFSGQIVDYGFLWLPNQYNIFPATWDLASY